MNNRILEGKRILFIAARFFGYEDEISGRLRYWGAEVDYYDQRPSNSFLTKALIRINNKILSRRIERYYAQIAALTKGRMYDFVLMISPESVTKEALMTLRQVHTGSRFVLYMWDSLRNKSQSILEVLPLFDLRFSFDRETEFTGLHFHHRPLFFLNEYSKLANRAEAQEMRYDATFVGTIHSDRFRILKILAKQFEGAGLSYFYHMYFPSRVLYYMRFLMNREFWSTTVDQFQFSALRKEEVISCIGASKIIIDIHHPQQTGLTMRTLEAIGAGRKLITTNSDVRNYDFYSPANIAIVDRKQLSIDPQFFHREMVELDPFIYNRYSIDGWITEIFGEK
jgi:hypothetical protein